MRFRTLLTGLLLVLLAWPAFADQTLLLRQPALSQDHLAFVYAGDIWVSDWSGQNARRLTSGAATEDTPVFSPDGSMIAFRAAYENNNDVYVMPVAGGQPQRLTWHPARDTPQGWSKDGKEVFFVSARETDHGRSGQLFSVSVDGGFPAKQMEARIVQGSYSDGGELAYIIFIPGYNGLFGFSAGWKGYRGGTAPEINIMDAAKESVTTVPGEGSTNFNPFWVGGRSISCPTARTSCSSCSATIRPALQLKKSPAKAPGIFVPQAVMGRPWCTRPAAASSGSIWLPAPSRNWRSRSLPTWPSYGRNGKTLPKPSPRPTFRATASAPC
jgi:hypothetical protein